MPAPLDLHCQESRSEYWPASRWTTCWRTTPAPASATTNAATWPSGYAPSSPGTASTAWRGDRPQRHHHQLQLWRTWAASSQSVSCMTSWLGRRYLSVL